MFDVMRGWVDRFLSEEEAVLLAVILIVSSVVIVTMGRILAPLLTGVVLAYVMQGTIKSLRRANFPNSLAVWCTFILFLGGFVSLLFLVIPRVWRQMQSLFEDLPQMVNETEVLLSKLPERYPQLISEQMVSSWGDLLSAEVGEIGQWLLSVSLSQLPLVLGVAVYTMLVPLLVFFLLKDQDRIITWCVSFLPDKRPLLNRIGTEMNVQMSGYIRGKVVEIIVVGVVTYLCFKLFGLDYAVLLAFLVGLSVIVPYVGFVAVTFPVLIIAYLQFGWTTEFFYLVAGYMIIQAVDGFVIVPLLFSEAVNLHPIAIITAILVFGSWWGLWGVFFAIPLATLVKAVLTSWPRGVLAEPDLAEP
jgi:putative permease